jgi:hypothetical protein
VGTQTLLDRRVCPDTARNTGRSGWATGFLTAAGSLRQIRRFRAERMMFNLEGSYVHQYISSKYALMAPGLPDLESVRAVCAAVGKPFNFMVGIKGKSFTVAALAAARVKRISLATSLYRAAMTGLLRAAKEVREHGTFGYIDTSLATPDMNAFLRE